MEGIYEKIILLFLVVFSIFGSGIPENLINYNETVRVNAKTDIVYIADTGTKYHTANCRTLKKNKYKITKREAIEQGYTACKVCKPGN